jgi:hypothetical protein
MDYKDQCSVVKRELFFAELASTLAMTLAAVARPAMLLSIGRNKGSLQDAFNIGISPSILAFPVYVCAFTLAYLASIS